MHSAAFFSADLFEIRAHPRTSLQSLKILAAHAETTLAQVGRVDIEIGCRHLHSNRHAASEPTGPLPRLKTGLRGPKMGRRHSITQFRDDKKLPVV